jgi:alanyl-tRNA synthetase
MVKLLGESSIGAGVRRVEALVGVDAYRFLAREHVLLAQVSEQLKARPEELPERIAGVLSRLHAAEKELDRLRSAELLASAGALAAAAADVHGAALVAHRAPDGTRPDDLRRLVLDVRGRLPGQRPGVVAAVTVTGDKPAVVVAVNDAARERGIKAGELVRTAAAALGGGGGGRDDVAQGGGQDPSAVAEALRQVERAVGSRMASGGS